MAIEWSERGKYSSFNSWKGLTYINHYRAIVADHLLPPIEASLDPAGVCQLSCRWCGSYSFLSPQGSRYRDMAMRRMPPGHLLRLADFLVEWGVQGFCLGGGGEPSLSPDCPEVIRYIRERDREVAFITNGVDLSPALLDALPLCRWVGISVDAASESDYHRLKGGPQDAFYRVLRNLADLADRAAGSCDVSFKFLVVPDNVRSILAACRLAKEIGVREFHARPAKIESKEAFIGQEAAFDVPMILDLFAACHELEDERFRVITSWHKFGEGFKVRNDFQRCWSSPLQIQCCADGRVYACQDQRMEPRFRLGSHHPEPERILDWWGKEDHLRILKEVRPKEDCPACFLPGAKVYTSTGIKMIQNIKTGEEVLTGKGRMKKVIRSYESDYQGEIISILLWGDNNRIFVTPNHKISSISVKKCSYLSRNNYCLGNPCSILRLHQKSECRSLQCLKPSNSYKIEKIEAGNLTTENFLIIPKPKTTISPKNIPVDLAWLLGIYLAEGRYEERTKNHRGYEVFFSLSEKEDEYINRIRDIIVRHFGINGQKPRIGNGSLTQAFSSKELLKLVSNFNRGGYNKYIPWEYIYSMSNESLISLIQGYFDGDGCYHTDKRGGKMVSATSVSTSLLYGISNSLSRLGVISRLRKEPKRISYINGREINYRYDPYSIFVSPSESADKVFPNKFLSKKVHPRKIYETEEYFAVPIRSIEVFEYHGKVYNLEVEEDHSYTVERVAVENCTYGVYAEQIEHAVVNDEMMVNFP